MDHLQGQTTVTGASGKVYTFKFGFKSRKVLGRYYNAETLEKLSTDAFLRIVLFSGLFTHAKANEVAEDLQPDADRVDEILDDLTEEQIKQVFDLAVHAMGFTARLLGATQQPEPTSLPATEAPTLTGTDS